MRAPKNISPTSLPLVNFRTGRPPRSLTIIADSHEPDRLGVVSMKGAFHAAAARTGVCVVRSLACRFARTEKQLPKPASFPKKIVRIGDVLLKAVRIVQTATHDHQATLFVICSFKGRRALDPTVQPFPLGVDSGNWYTSPRLQVDHCASRTDRNTPAAKRMSQPMNVS